jgi:threonine dehydrogenase-like Zn-dependent dehydrogenase
MKHLGFHLDGVFADRMNFPAYTIFPIPDADKWIAKVGKQNFALQMVNAEPLACAQRAYNILDEKGNGRFPPNGRMLILGAGPMGLIHALHAQRKYPDAEIFLYDTDETRRRLATPAAHKAKVLNNLVGMEGSFNTVVMVTSDRQANVKDAARLVSDKGVVLLFSGIDMKAGDPRPMVESTDIEKVHRSEEKAIVNNEGKEILFLGSSGYTKDDIARSVQELYLDLSSPETLFRKVQTLILNGFEKFADVENRDFFKLHNPANHQHLKIAVVKNHCLAIYKNNRL